MRSRVIKATLYIIVMIFASNIVLAGASSPVGYWKQMSDKTGKLQSIVKIYRSHDALEGKVVRAFKMNGQMPQKYCTKCPGTFKNKRIIGMVFLWGFKLNPATGWFEEGHILDPNSGDLYKCKMALIDNGTKLDVRGYIGISLFGRTQTWLWIPPSQVKAELAKGMTNW
jgi:uncharacterized protein (DUF2147 family)